MEPAETTLWSIKHKTRPGGCQSSIPYCGYDNKTLFQMANKGYELFHNGKKIPLKALKTDNHTTTAKADRKFTESSQLNR